MALITTTLLAQWFKHLGGLHKVVGLNPDLGNFLLLYSMYIKTWTCTFNVYTWYVHCLNNVWTSMYTIMDANTNKAWNICFNLYIHVCAWSVHCTDMSVHGSSLFIRVYTWYIHVCTWFISVHPVECLYMIHLCSSWFTSFCWKDFQEVCCLYLAFTLQYQLWTMLWYRNWLFGTDTVHRGMYPLRMARSGG